MIKRLIIVHVGALWKKSKYFILATDGGGAATQLNAPESIIHLRLCPLIVLNPLPYMGIPGGLKKKYILLIIIL